MRSIPLLSLSSLLAALVSTAFSMPLLASEWRVTAQPSRPLYYLGLLGVRDTTPSFSVVPASFSASADPTPGYSSVSSGGGISKSCSPSAMTSDEGSIAAPATWSYVCIENTGVRIGFPSPPSVLEGDDYLWVGTLNSIRTGYRMTRKQLARSLENTARNRRELMKLYVEDATPKQVSPYKEITVSDRPAGSVQGIYQSDDRPRANVSLIGIIDGADVWLVEIVTVRSSLAQHQATVQKLLAEITLAPLSQ